MSFVSTKTGNPPKTGVYAVQYVRAKAGADQVRTGKAKFVKSRNEWKDIKGVSGKMLEKTFNQLSSQNRTRAPKVLAWSAVGAG